MARFDIYRAEGGFLLDVQAGLFDHLDTRVVVPLLMASTTPPAVKRLHPIFEIDGVRHVMATPLLSAIPAGELRNPAGNLAGHHDEIVAALDMLFQGF